MLVLYVFLLLFNDGWDLEVYFYGFIVILSVVDCFRFYVDFIFNFVLFIGVKCFFDNYVSFVVQFKWFGGFGVIGQNFIGVVLYVFSCGWINFENGNVKLG